MQSEQRKTSLLTCLVGAVNPVLLGVSPIYNSRQACLCDASEHQKVANRS